jgi:hypothetical protein
MRIYKNPSLAFFYHALVGLFSAILVYFMGLKGMVFIALIAFRPFIFELQKIDTPDAWFFHNYRILLYSVYATCTLIILFYLIDFLFIPQQIIADIKYRIILMIIPTGMFFHGVIGYFYFKKHAV